MLSSQEYPCAVSMRMPAIVTGKWISFYTVILSVILLFYYTNTNSCAHVLQQSVEVQLS